MSDKKHIDRLFQEKLKNFEQVPKDAVWDNIHNRLHKNKGNRRVFPIWWRIAGVAALLALLFTVGIKLISNDIDSDVSIPVVDSENQSPIKSKEQISPEIDNSKSEDQLDDSSNVASENNTNSEDFSNNNSADSSISKTKKNQLQQKKTTVSGTGNNSITSNTNSDSKYKGSVDKESKNGISEGSPDKNNTSNTKDAVATVLKNNSGPMNLEAKKEKSEIDKLIDSKNSANTKVSSASDKIENIISEDGKEKTQIDKSIEDAIAEANTEDEKEKEKKLNRWNISPSVAPVYFSSLGQGSSLDNQFVDNSKSSEITMSYGVGGSYAINEKLKVRAGINKVDMGYKTNNVIAFKNIDESSQARSQLTNVSMTASADDMTFLSTESLNRNITPEIINSKSEGSLNQRFGFIEIPMEVEYALINKKLGLNVIGGFSTLIVDKNEIYSVIEGTETRIGEANNINDMSYSANFGLGINYNISEKVKLNVEPTFKYQINTFNNSSGDFQPFFIGVYTGLSYKF